ncbi:hypothetical protein ACEPAI_8347 [Sanghuangporus weigelae]
MLEERLESDKDEKRVVKSDSEKRLEETGAEESKASRLGPTMLEERLESDKDEKRVVKSDSEKRPEEMEVDWNLSDDNPATSIHSAPPSSSIDCASSCSELLEDDSQTQNLKKLYDTSGKVDTKRARPDDGDDEAKRTRAKFKRPKRGTLDKFFGLQARIDEHTDVVDEEDDEDEYQEDTDDSMGESDLEIERGPVHRSKSACHEHA